MKVKVGLAQMAPVLGQLASNLKIHLDLVQEANGQNVDLLIFPELSLTGYWLREEAFSVAVKPSDEDTTFGPLLEASRFIDLVVGFVEKDRRHRYFISAAYLAQGRIVHIHRKLYLPTYGIFEEGRYFAPGSVVQAFDSQFGRVGLLICEDFWHVSPPYLLWLDGADLLIMISATPAREQATQYVPDSAQRVALLNQAYASLFTNFIVQVNRVGSEEDADFFGGSTIFGPQGNQIVQPTYYKEGLFTAELDLDELRLARTRLPLLRDERSDLTAREFRRILQSR